MTQSRKILKNSSINVAQNVFNIIVSIFVNGYIANKLGVTEYGKFIFAFSFTLLFYVLTDLGLESLYTRKIAGDKNKTDIYLGDVLLIKLILSIVALFIVLSLLYFIPHPRDTKIAVLIACLGVLVFQPMFTSAWAVFNAHEEMKYVAYSNTLSRVTVAVLSIAVLQLGGGMIWITLVYTAGYGLQVIYCAIVVGRGFERPIYRMTHKKLLGIVRSALPFSLFSIFYLLSLQTDKTMLSFLVGDDAVGVYNAAAALCFNSTMISNAVATAAFPSLVQTFREANLEAFANKTRTLLKWMLILGTPFSIVTMFYAEEIIRFIYRSESYLPSVIALQIMIWMLPIDFLSRIVRYSLIASNREQFVTWTCGIALLLNVALNFILIPAYSYIGAVISTLVSQTIFMLLQLFVLARTSVNVLKLPWIRVIIGNLLLFMLLSSGFYNGYWILGILIGLLFYFMQMVVYNVITKEDYALLKLG